MLLDVAGFPPPAPAPPRPRLASSTAAAASPRVSGTSNVSPCPGWYCAVRVERLPLLRRRRAVADRHGRGLAVKLVVRPAGRRRVVEEPRDAVVVVVAEELELLQPGRRLGSSIPFHRRLLHPHPLKDRRKPPVQVRRDPAPHPSTSTTTASPTPLMQQAPALPHPSPTHPARGARRRRHAAARARAQAS